MSALRGLLLLVLCSCAAAAVAADTPLAFDDPVRQRRYDDLLAELRCLVCQNQSLADSHADLAQDLRDEVYRMVSAGASDEEVHAFMVERYGDFVLYRPPVKSSTLLLWLAPAALALVAVIVVIRLARRRTLPPAALNEEERARLAELVAAERRDSGAGSD
ncbi:MAG: cytochrome c-type biogenesis protein [Gammaproteobacteria bacterium]